jgi:hypothetical protein
VLLSGRAGIGKSRLVQALTEQVASKPLAWLTPWQCSPDYQNTALYPMIELLERVALRFDRAESSQQKLRKLEGFVVQYGLPLEEAAPSSPPSSPSPLSADDAPLTASPVQQKQQTLHALLTTLRRPQLIGRPLSVAAPPGMAIPRNRTGAMKFVPGAGVGLLLALLAAGSARSQVPAAATACTSPPGAKGIVRRDRPRLKRAWSLTWPPSRASMKSTPPMRSWTVGSAGAICCSRRSLWG